MASNRVDDQNGQPAKPVPDVPGRVEGDDEVSSRGSDGTTQDVDRPTDLLDAEALVAEVDKIEEELALLRGELDRLAEAEPGGETEGDEQAATDTDLAP